MSVDVCERLIGWDGVQAAFDEVRACHADYRTFFQGVFEELDSLSTELQSRQQHVARTAGAQTEAASSLSDAFVAQIETLLASLGQQQSQIERLVREGEHSRGEAARSQETIEAQVSRLAAVAGELADRAEPPAETSPGAAWQARFEEQLAEAARVRAELARQQETVAAQVARLAAVAGELAEAQRAAEARTAQAISDEPAWREALAALETQSQQVHASETSIAAQLARLTELAQQLAAAHTEKAGSNVQWQLKAEEDLAAVARQQEAMANEVARLSSVAAELAEARRELTARCDDLKAASAMAANPVDAEAERQLREQLRVMADEHRALQIEHSTLEMELDAVRGRAAELTETLSAEKRLFAQQQNAWTEELQRMRRLLERLTERVEDSPPPAPAAKAAPAKATAAGAAASSDDPVLDSVMAQFAMLQKDVARRRAPSG